MERYARRDDADDDETVALANGDAHEGKEQAELEAENAGDVASILGLVFLPMSGTKVSSGRLQWSANELELGGERLAFKRVSKLEESGQRLTRPKL